jgi:hypothetical protein
MVPTIKVFYYNGRDEELGRGNVEFGIPFAIPMGAIRGVLYLQTEPIPDGELVER